jgi:divalent metal cation (Fe/Co/Zn/Cd) transporter
LNSLFVAMVLTLTVSTATVVGIAAAYGLITGILYAFAYRQSQRLQSRVLVTEASHASGD